MSRRNGSAATATAVPESATASHCIPPLDAQLIPADPSQRQREALREALGEPLAAAQAALEDARGYLQGSDPESALAALHALHNAAAAGLRAGGLALRSR